MAVFYKYDYRKKRKNIHPWLYVSWDGWDAYLIFVTPRVFSCKFFLAGVNVYRFNATNWQFTVYFAVITQKIGNFCVFCRNLRAFLV